MRGGVEVSRFCGLSPEFRLEGCLTCEDLALEGIGSEGIVWMGEEIEIFFPAFSHL